MPTFTKNRWLSLAVLLIGFFMILVDTTIVNVSIPTIIKDLHTNLSDVEWIISGYSLTFAALLITFGRFGDLYGRKKLFIAGLALFTIASVFSGEAQTASALIMARLLQGVGGAMISPATLSIISSTFRGKDRAVAFGMFGAISGIAAAIGPVAGGWLTTYHSWRWIFRVNIPIGIIGIILASLFVAESKAEQGEKVDISGMITSSFGFFFLVFGLIEGQNYGWIKPVKDFVVGSYTWSAASHSLSIIAISFILSLIFLGSFIAIQRYKTFHDLSPAVNLHLFAFKTFRYGLIAIAIIALGEFSSLFTLPIFLQSIRGYTPLQSGYATLPLALSIMVGAPLSATIVNRLGSKRVITAGITLEAIGLLLFSRLNADSTYATLVPGLIVLGFGIGLAISQNTQVILSEIDPRQSGSASGTLNTVRQIGTALGIAVIGAVLAHQASVRIPDQIRSANLTPLTFEVQNKIANTAGSNSTSYTGSQDTAQYAPTPPADIQNNPQALIGYNQQITNVETTLRHSIDIGLSQSIAFAIRVGAAFIALGALLSLLIPNVQAHKNEEESMPSGH
jgi:EmrB/QacA subfamily drug resistance transporter